MFTPYPASQVGVPTAGSRDSRATFAALFVLVSVLGLSTIWPALLVLWNIWTTDALKSIGMIFPFASLILILRVWRSLRWRVEGTWWGLLILLLTTAVEWIQQRSVLLLVVSPHWMTPLPPPSFVLFAYGSGAVLLIGGTRLYRAALFPIVLLLFANPVPHVFSLLVDLPLQHASALIARSFAMHLRQPLTPDHLRLMFTPEFGMFIAPGCNGIRGSVTMGFIALIAGYLYRFRWYVNALVVTGAVFLGYVFNLLRLCLLVLYYLLALHFTSLQDKAENADYLIGAALFLTATILLITVIQRLGDSRGSQMKQETLVADIDSAPVSIGRMRTGSLLAMTVVVIYGCAGLGRARAAMHPAAAAVLENGTRPFPKHLGGYELQRTWNETLMTGQIIYAWAEYAPVTGGRPVAIGVAPQLGWHDPLICHAARGEHPLWQGQLTVTTADHVPIAFSSAFYADGVVQSLEASTQCSGTSCGEFATESTHFGLVYSDLNSPNYFSQDNQPAIPVLVRTETLDVNLPADTARQQLTQDLKAFLVTVGLDDLTQAYRR